MPRKKTSSRSPVAKASRTKSASVPKGVAPAGRAPARANLGSSQATPEQLKRLAGKVVRRLKADYPDAQCALQHRSPFELLIATILSAQCTDKRVNLVTKDLFARYPTPAHFAAASQKSIERAVQSTGFFRNKAKNIRACCAALVDRHGETPQTMEELVALEGVGRKTANVVLGTAFGVAAGVVVDTHVGRISRRLGLTSQSDAVKVERDLMSALPKKEWIDFSHRVIHHGRQVCGAPRPDCEACSMQNFCAKVGVSD